MNQENLKHIFSNYIEKFDVLNESPHEEYYKWQIAKKFPKLMDAALAASDKDFPAALAKVQKLTENLIDSKSVHPFSGLCQIAKKEPEAVRSLFLALYASDGGDMTSRMGKVQAFLEGNMSLVEHHYGDKSSYNPDFHAITVYLFLYDPDHNYLFKPTKARKFADCVEFCDDWGSGTGVKLDVYYRMCDQLVESIKKNEELLTVNKRRYYNFGNSPELMHPDNELHILAVDIIHCCGTEEYGLYDGISFTSLSAKERQKLLAEQKEKELLLEKQLDAESKMELLKEALAYLDDIWQVGEEVVHKKWGKGIIVKHTGRELVVNFISVGQKSFCPVKTFTHDWLDIFDAKVDEAKVKAYQVVLENKNNIESAYNNNAN